MLQANSSEERANGVVGSSGRDRAVLDLPERVGKRLLIPTNDLVRLLQQALRKLGYTSIADRLEEDSVSQQSYFSEALIMHFILYINCLHSKYTFLQGKCNAYQKLLHATLSFTACINGEGNIVHN